MITHFDYCVLLLALQQAPAEDHVRYIPWDFKYYAKLRGGQILSDIVPVMTCALDETNFFLCAPAVPSSEGRRTNASDWVRPWSIMTSASHFVAGGASLVSCMYTRTLQFQETCR